MSRNFREVPHVRQIQGDPLRRWFSTGHMDLIVWYDGEVVLGFQLTYGEPEARALTWLSDAGYQHNAVDEGESEPGRYKATPVLAQTIPFKRAALWLDLAEASQTLPQDLRLLVVKHVIEAEKTLG